MYGNEYTKTPILCIFCMSVLGSTGLGMVEEGVEHRVHTPILSVTGNFGRRFGANFNDARQVSRGVEPPPPLLPHVDLHPITKRRSSSRPMALNYLPPATPPPLMRVVYVGLYREGVHVRKERWEGGRLEGCVKFCR